ncbi:MAG: 4Fe-4S binding protein [Peptococcaceae bacterium]|nr:4Fe-4S binding protein [Peptococcaceae bacterium]
MGHHTIKNGYQSFADRLNLLPQGAPQTEALFPLLRALVSEKEAEILSLLPVRPFSVEKAAKALKKPVTETEKILTDLASKAMLLDVTDPAGNRQFILPPPMAGFFEFSLMRMGGQRDQKQISALLYEYLNVEEDFVRELFVTNTKLGRILVNEKAYEQSKDKEQDENIPHELHILDYERTSHILKSAGTIAVGTCYCRHKMLHMGKNCDAPLDVCLTLGNTAKSLIKYGHARELTLSEAMDAIELSQEHHLVQIGENEQKDMPFICNCCGCCCEALLAIKRFGTLNSINTTSFLPQVSDNCIGCGKCAKICPVDCIQLEKIPLTETELSEPNDFTVTKQESKRTISKKQGKYRIRLTIDESVCLGCGLCVQACPTQAITLRQRENTIITPVTASHRIVLAAIDKGRLANLIFDNQAFASHRAMAAILGAILKLPPAKQLLAKEQIRSHYLANLLDKK